MKAVQKRFGTQPRPYADHVWEWEVQTDRPVEEALAWCRANLKDAPRSETEYRDGKNSAPSFSDMMQVVCEGRYSISPIPGGYRYTVTRDYID